MAIFLLNSVPSTCWGKKNGIRIVSVDDRLQVVMKYQEITHSATVTRSRNMVAKLSSLQSQNPLKRIKATMKLKTCVNCMLLQ